MILVSLRLGYYSFSGGLPVLTAEETIRCRFLRLLPMHVQNSGIDWRREQELGPVTALGREEHWVTILRAAKGWLISDPGSIVSI